MTNYYLMQFMIVNYLKYSARCERINNSN